MKYTYSYVEVYGLQFEPYVVTDQSDNVLLFGYFYGSKIHSAAYENAYSELKANFTKIYGTPDEAEDHRYTWHFEDGTRLLVTNTGVFVDDNWISVELAKVQ